MHSRTIDVVTDWETVATPAGYEGLHQLADAEFSGAASAGTAWAFLLNGRIIGVFEGDVEDFAEADVTAYRAADPSLPLLFAMQERGGETRANYYTNETPLTDVDQKLSSGGFTGYIELSDNVLSGDYYVVYHGGKSMSAAFVGSSERLLTGEEAFEAAADEVGIYEVIDVGVDIVDVPEPAGDADDGREADAGEETAAAGAGAAGAAAGRSASSTEPEASAGGSAPADGSADDPDAPADASTSDAESAAAADPRDAGETAGGAATATDPDTEAPDARDDGHEPSETGAAAHSTGADGTDAESAGGPVDAPGDPDSAGAGAGPRRDAGPRDDAGTERTGGSDAGRGGSEAETPADGAGSGEAGPGSRAPASGGSHADEESAGTGAAAGGAEPTGRSAGRDPGPADAAASESATDRGVGDSRAAATSTATPRATGESGESASPADPDDAVADERRWQEARTIPSLDPEKSSGTPAPDAEEDDRDAGRERTARMQRRRERRRSRRDTEHADATQATSSAGSRDDAGETATEREADDGAERLRRRLARARERVASLEAEREELQEERAELRDEREELQEERDRLRAERDDRVDRIEELETECDRLRAEVDRLESELDADAGGTSAAESISPERALSGTNLFVRYDTKGQATLKHAHAGDADRDDVRENLRLEHHTTFETDGVVVDDRPYEAFLHDSTEYAFAHWVTSELLYEIGETGNRSGLAGVFDAIPDVDRVELHGEVGVETDDGVEQRAFDVICRDRMGDPLFVADINPSRNATTEAMVGSLVGNTGTVAAEEESVAAGFYVTESFYEPGALETVAEETGGGLLSRSSKLSYVKLSRKRGYHLCLAEARNGEFHLNVPDL